MASRDRTTPDRASLSDTTRNRIFDIASGGRRAKKRPMSPVSPYPIPTTAGGTPIAPADGADAAPPQQPQNSSQQSALSGGRKTAEGSEIPTLTLDDLGGLDEEKKLLEELIEYPLKKPQLFAMLGADPTSGILLHGVPGSGKTTLARAVAGTMGVPLFSVSAPELVSGVSGDSEAQVRKLFASATESAPSILFIDEIDAIGGRRDEAQKDMSKRIVSQLLTCMDGLTTAWRMDRKVVIVLGATSRLETIDPGLRRGGRFDREIGLGIPTIKARQQILRVLCKQLKLSTDVSFEELAMRTPGYVCADLHAVTKEATAVAIRRLVQAGLTEDEASISIINDDLIAACSRVQPSAMREGFSVVPNVTWEDVGAMDSVREELVMSIVRPIRNPDAFRALGVHQSMGVLLYGPPGCGKTLVAKAVAREAGANFISIKGPELLNKFVGESERSVRTLFSRARASAPCVLFFDELDALAPRRGSDNSNSSSERVVNQLLTEMDGVDARDVHGVYVIGATNRPDMIDPALCRPGRLDKVLRVSLPDEAQRRDILATLSRKVPLSLDVDLGAVASDKRCEGFSGADLAALLREAALDALREGFKLDPPIHKTTISPQNVNDALSKLRASVSTKDRESYDSMLT
eukprot:PhM_4_TR14275/c0_g1_i1/m.4859/K14571/RIX7, NVL; ribosome biogenesis ATPase